LVVRDWSRGLKSRRYIEEGKVMHYAGTERD
jgi:hypothetical protein